MIQLQVPISSGEKRKTQLSPPSQNIGIVAVSPSGPLKRAVAVTC